MGRYMNMNKLDQEAKGGPIAVRGFQGLTFWVIPDPKDTENVKAAQDRYNEGYSINFKDWKITEEQYNDPTFWNGVSR
jgi:hypothetical protein